MIIILLGILSVMCFSLAGCGFCRILKIREHSEMADEAAWFHAKWGVPLEA